MIGPPACLRSIEPMSSAPAASTSPLPPSPSSPSPPSFCSSFSATDGGRSGGGGELELKLIPYPDTPARPGALPGDTAYFASLRVAAAETNGAASARFTELKNMIFDEASDARLPALLLDDSTGETVIDEQEEGSGQTLLHLTAFFGRPLLAKTLVDLGACISLPNAEGRTALDLAIDWGHVEVADVLRNAGGHSSLDERVRTLQAKNAALARSLDLARRQLQRQGEAAAQRDAELVAVRSERDAALASALQQRTRAQASERRQAVGETELITAQREATELKQRHIDMTHKIMELRKQAIDMALRTAEALKARAKTMAYRKRVEKKLARARARKDKMRSICLLAQEKYKAAKLKLALSANELGRRDKEVLLLEAIEATAKRLKRRLKKQKSMTLMEALRAFVPVDVLTKAFRTLQHLAAAGEGIVDVRRQRHARTPPVTAAARRGQQPQQQQQRPQLKKQHTCTVGKVAESGQVEDVQEKQDASVAAAGVGEGSAAAVKAHERELEDSLKLPPLVAKAVQRTLEWEDPVFQTPRSRLLGGVKLPFPLMAVTPVGVSCIVVSRACFDETTGEETLIVVDGASVDDLDEEVTGGRQLQ